MNFLSPEFAVAFPLFLVLYWAFRRAPRIQNWLALAASYLVVAGLNTYFGLVLAGFTLGIHGCAWLIQRYRAHGRVVLLLAVALAICNLAVFKYFDFFRESLDTLLDGGGLGAWIPAVQIVMPLGISFYTFHSISYLVSLQRAEVPRVSLPTLALFLAFFPSVIAGPINRAADFLPQIMGDAPRTLDGFPQAFLLIVMGILKVVWLGAFLATTWADPVFADPGEFHALDALLGLLAYSGQLYLNFSGYTDLVTGLALLLGYRLPPNFRAPYVATNLRHFWERWHISLSTWIRDYLYIPLGGSRKGFARTQLNLMIAMVLSGLWHGASSNFLIWGAIHGVGMVVLNLGDRWLGRDAIGRHLPALANTATVLYVALAWIFFRCPTLGLSLDFLSALTHWDRPLQFDSPLYLLLMVLGLRVYPLLATATERLLQNVGRLPWPVMPPVFAALAWLGVTLSPPGIPAFIYAGF